jgi:hypothetical protein
VSDEEIRIAEDKFEESKALAENAMHNLLENEVGKYYYCKISQVLHFFKFILHEIPW